MSTLKITTDPEFEKKMISYPDHIRNKMHRLRQLVIQTAENNDQINALHETLKWGEPSFLTKYGSTLRMDWKEKTPDQYAMYFKCTSKLVPSFQNRYGDLFQYEKTRAILFDMEDKIPEKELTECIDLALNYHKIKHQLDVK